jgi:hypothetical protein
MLETLQHYGGYIASAIIALISWIWRNRAVLREHAWEAARFADKYCHGASNAALEDEAVGYLHEHWPEIDELKARLVIRELLELAKRRKEGELR